MRTYSTHAMREFYACISSETSKSPSDPKSIYDTRVSFGSRSKILDTDAIFEITDRDEFNFDVLQTSENTGMIFQNDFFIKLFELFIKKIESFINWANIKNVFKYFTANAMSGYFQQIKNN